MLYIVLPAYNEEESIGPLFEAIIKAMNISEIEYRVVLVNDGSSDKTEVRARSFRKKMPLSVINHSKNRGWPQAVNSGFKYVLRRGTKGDLVVTMDTDNTHPPNLIVKMRKMVNKGYDVVIASRFQPGARVVGLSWIRQALSLGNSFVFRAFFPIKGVKDYSCGYRVYRYEVLKKAYLYYKDNFIDQKGFSFMPDILLKLRKFDFKIAEVPFTLRYDFKKSTSKMRIIKTIFETLGLLFKKRARIST